MNDQNQSINSNASNSNLQRIVDRMNAEIGNLPDFDCEICKNKGFVFLADGDREIAQQCKCVVTRSNIRHMRSIGLDLDDCGLERYTATEGWQKLAKQTAIDYSNHLEGWFFIGGAVGCGKTLLCSSILKEQLHKGMSAKYMAWRDEAGRLKATVNDNAEYLKLIEPLKTVGILYIDDFFKAASITKGDVNLAFEIINSRYVNKRPTIISCELSIDDIISIDEALGSRIYERTKGHYVYIKGGERKNYRMR
jgi:DNA replication protein DnaC